MYIFLLKGRPTLKYAGLDATVHSLLILVIISIRLYMGVGPKHY